MHVMGETVVEHMFVVGEWGVWEANEGGRLYVVVVMVGRGK